MTPTEPTVALVFSPEAWVEELHRHLADHGGARVRQIVVEPSVALDEDYDALVVSDRWPALTASFVEAVHARGRMIVGVFDPAEPAGKGHLGALGVDATLPGDADPAEFVTVLRGIAPADGTARRLSHTPADGAHGSYDGTWGRLVAVAGPRGAGVTEVAVALAVAVARRPGSAVLVDGHDAAPALAARLSLGVEPNLRSAVDAHSYGLGELGATLVQPASAPGLRVMAGFPSLTAAAQVAPRDAVDVVNALRRSHGLVVVDVDSGPHAPIGHAVIASSAIIVAVGLGTPVGVIRLLERLTDLRALAPTAVLHVVVNRVPRDRFRQSEIASEICRAVPSSTLAFVPTDRRVEDAGWEGAPVGSGPFVEALATLAATLAPVVPRRRRTRRARREVSR